MTTNIMPEHLEAFEALRDDAFGNFALFSCFVNGEPASAIVAINRDGEDFLELAAKIPIETQTETFPLAEANRALNALRHDAVRGAAVLMLD